MWKAIEGYEGVYEVSNCGMIRRINRPRGQEPNILTQQKDHKGYLRVALCVNGKVNHFSVHRLVARAFIGPWVGDITVNHINGDKLNNNVQNLEYCTRLENTRHAVSIGKISLSNAKINPDIVRIIRKRYISGTESSLLMAKEFGVARRTIVRIANRELWWHIN